MKQPKEHLPTGDARKRQLAEQRADDELWAAWAHRTPRCKTTLTESFDSGEQGYDNRAESIGDKSAFRQICGAQGVIGVIR